jgi:hypothetical protein
MDWNVSIGPEKWHIFGCFLTLFPFAGGREKKHLQHGGD